MSELRRLSRASRWKVVLLRRALDFLFAVLTQRQVFGLENIPAAGSCLVVFNHLSNFDPPLIFTLLRRTDATGLMADNYRQRWFYRIVVETGGGMWLKRGASDRGALTAALSLLRRGWIVAITPEGRRSPTRALIEGKRGPAFLAARADVPIVPVGLTNTENLGRALKRLRRITLTVRVGKPFRLPPLDRMDEKSHLKTCTEIIMCHIAALLPPKYRGVYDGHPRLRSLLADLEPFGPGSCGDRGENAPAQ